MKDAKALSATGDVVKATEKLQDAQKEIELIKARPEYSGLYDSKATRTDLETTYGADNVKSSTVVNNPPQRVNSNPDKGIEVVTDSYGNKAVKVDYIDPTTGQAAKANIPYDSRGIAVFDDVAKYTTKIDESLSYTSQMKQATLDLKEAINNGSIDASKFTQNQLADIQSGRQTIEGYTWHHNAQSSPNNMQLIPKTVHDAALHIGQGSLSVGK